MVELRRLQQFQDRKKISLWLLFNHSNNSNGGSEWNWWERAELCSLVTPMWGKQGGFTGFSSELVVSLLFVNDWQQCLGKNSWYVVPGRRNMPGILWNVYLGCMNKPCLLLFLSPQIHACNCSYKWLSGPHLCMSGPEPTSWASRSFLQRQEKPWYRQAMWGVRSRRSGSPHGFKGI